VDPILSGHPLLSGQQHKSPFSPSRFTVKNTRIQRTPLLSGRGHLKLDFYGHFYCYKTCIKRTLVKGCMLFVHVLIDRSFNFADRRAASSKTNRRYHLCFSKNMIKLVIRDLTDKTFVWQICTYRHVCTTITK